MGALFPKHGSSAMSAPHFQPKAKRVIFLFMAGAPSQLDLFDHKPELHKKFKEPLPDSVRDDVHLIRDEVERCRNILNRLSLDSGRSAGEPLVEATVAQLVDEVLNDLPPAERVMVGVRPDASHRTLFIPLVSLAQALRGFVQPRLAPPRTVAPRSSQPRR